MNIKSVFLKSIIGILFMMLVIGGYRMVTAKLTYSNMVDEKTLNQVSHDLIVAGVPEKNVFYFKKQVNDTNKFLGNFHTFK